MPCRISLFLWQKQVTPSAFINFCYQAQLILTFSMIDSEKILGSVYKKSANLLSTTLLWCLFIVLGDGFLQDIFFRIFLFLYFLFLEAVWKSHRLSQAAFTRPLYYDFPHLSDNVVYNQIFTSYPNQTLYRITSINRSHSGAKVIQKIDSATMP